MKKFFAFALVSLTLACGSDDTEADRLGVAAECSTTEDCAQEPVALTCIPESAFKGGYCGVEGCVDDSECPEASRCVVHDDGKSYCFRVCQDKELDCNANRTPDNEANCSSSITFVDSGDTAKAGNKACVPPSGS